MFYEQKDNKARVNESEPEGEIRLKGLTMTRTLQVLQTIVRNLGFSSKYNEKALEQFKHGGYFICLSADDISKTSIPGKVAL